MVRKRRGSLGTVKGKKPATTGPPPIAVARKRETLDRKTGMKGDRRNCQPSRPRTSVFIGKAKKKKGLQSPLKRSPSGWCQTSNSKRQ